MSETKKTYWKGLEQLTNNPEFVKNSQGEFPEYLPINENGEDGPNRRDFLKMMGFGVAAASLAACESPVRKAIPYLNKPVDVDPGIPNYYASTFISGSDYCSVVVKTREGRPIKVEGNALSPVSGGGTSAQVEASVLSLYDQQRLQTPMINGAASTWDEIDSAVMKQLGSLGGRLVVVSNSVFSPSTQKSLDQFLAKFNGEHVQYDQVSFHGILAANEKSFGTRAVPFYDFSKAKTIVSFDADFLGGWLNSTLFSRQFAATRKLRDGNKNMSRLYSFESNLSLTGANADYRTPIKPSQEGLLVANLYNLIAAKAGAPTIGAAKVDSPRITMAAEDLWKSKQSSVVVSGSNDESVQTIINAINSLLGAYNETIDIANPYQIRKGDDAKMTKLVNDVTKGSVAGIIFYNCNPVYDHAMGAQLAEAIGKAKFSMSTSDRMDETTAAVGIIAPDHHYLESWNDAEPVKGHFSLTQPTISNIFNTRQAQSSFLKWAGAEEDYFEFVKANWGEWHFANQSEQPDMQMFWDQCLHDGVYAAKSEEEAAAVAFAGDINGAASKVASTYKADNSGTELVLYTNAAIGNGIQANNPWLQEMSDPITKACWENYLTVSPSMATELGLKTGDMTTEKFNVTVGGTTVSVPVLIQPGQAKGTVGLALGYGRTKAGKVADGVGANAYPMADYSKGYQSLKVAGVTMENTGESYQVAQTQTSQTVMDRGNVLQEAVLSDYQKDPFAGRERPEIYTSEGFKEPAAISLWSGHEYPNHHWGMAIDLNSCTGCGACTIACQAENNIPVVGKGEVLNRREMAWLRIDRYYSSDADVSDHIGLEEAAENPEVTFQPMMCQQCNNAPCETVCPVAATTHSTEGLNQMTYNRCIGTRYCANNCPYKVRRFNWFKYHDNKEFGNNTAMNNDLGKMVLNPDVTVRARGVMEKCTFCVQRVQAGKLQAKREGRRPVDGEITSACAKACPSEAIVFGDLKNTESKVAQLLKLRVNEEGRTAVAEPRAYHVLEEIRVDPNVWYFTKIRNKDKTEA
ncbi:MAG: TAT-variant-translocated molybdopterin oxidoreductase [Cyclobacteriaceae bacterium]